MALTPDEATLLDSLLEESALAINDAIVATTAQQKLAAKTRYKNAMKALGKFAMNTIKQGIGGDY